jgi:hypothetical protein
LGSTYPGTNVCGLFFFVYEEPNTTAVIAAMEFTPATAAKNTRMLSMQTYKKPKMDKIKKDTEMPGFTN